MTRVHGPDLLLELVRLEMVAILFRFSNLVHRFGIDNFAVELISVDHGLTILHIFDERMRDYSPVVLHCHPKDNRKFPFFQLNCKGQKNQKEMSKYRIYQSTSSSSSTTTTSSGEACMCRRGMFVIMR